MRCSHNCQQCACTASNAHVRLQAIEYLNISGLVIALTHFTRSNVRHIWSICAFDQMRCASGKCAFDQSTNHDSNPNTNPNPNRNPIPNPNPTLHLTSMKCSACMQSWLNAHIWSNALHIWSNAQYAKCYLHEHPQILILPYACY